MGSTDPVLADGGSTPTPTPTSTGTALPPTDKPDAAPSTEPDAGPVVDMTPRFDLTLEGQPIAITNVTAKIEPASGTRPARVNVAGRYEQQLGQGLTSTATFFIYANAAETGADACGTGGRDAAYLFKDTDGAIRSLDATLQGGSCIMKIASSAAGGFTSGTATGVISGAKQKSFAVAWGQPIPKP